MLTSEIQIGAGDGSVVVVIRAGDTVTVVPEIFTLFRFRIDCTGAIA